MIIVTHLHYRLMNNTVIPFVYGLLFGKSATDYNLFVEKVLEQDSFQPESIITAFESSTIKSVEMLPNVLHKDKTSSEEQT